MKFWLIGGGVYLGFLAAQLLLPMIALWNRQGLDTLAVALFVLTAAAVVLATFTACLMASKALFPQYWWMGQVLGQDIFQFDGVYFIGLRLSRVPSRLQRLLFGADEQFRRWDMLFGLMFLVLLVPHTLAAVTAYRQADRILPRRILFPETLHSATLSALPLLREWQVKWSVDAVMTARLTQELEALQAKAEKSDADWFRMAQAEMLLAFRPRQSVLEPYAFAPTDPVYFDRGQGARATAIARRLITASATGAQPHRVDALVLVGFFHLSSYNFPKAVSQFQEALAVIAEGAPTSLSRPLVTLLAAHSAALAGNTSTARRMVEAQLADESLTPVLQALAFERLADILRLQGHYSAAQDFLDKALASYRRQKDPQGIARVSIYRAAIYADQGQRTAASQEISKASSQTAEADDLFIRNMVERISHLLPAVG
jgi:tetratricopeptide (TPR) repeat protein